MVSRNVISVMDISAANLVVGGGGGDDCLFNELHYVFSDYIMKMLAVATAIFVPMAVSCVVGSTFSNKLEYVLL